MLTPLILIKAAVVGCLSIAIGGLGYVASSRQLQTDIYYFLISPGWTSRLLLVVVVALNWKNLPLAWTVRLPTYLTPLEGRASPPSA